jgi:ubiquinone/menaquinone biosynthesis C-methylase UbiE
MPADPSIYASERIAAGYARHRPSIHPAVSARLRQQLKPDGRFQHALDAGCGAGASTSALLPLAEQVTGLDPFPAMLQQAAALVPGAQFVQGRLEDLPFGTACFDLVTTAGAINYTELPVALAELSRVLKPNGWLAAYDFSAGRRLHSPSDLPQLHAAFRRNYPSPPGYPLDLSALPLAGTGLSQVTHDTFTAAVPMTLTQYTDYMLSETGVELVIAAGASADAIRQTCQAHFQTVFADQIAEIVFDVELVIFRRA